MPEYTAVFTQLTTVPTYFEANSLEEAESIANNFESHPEIFAHQLDDERHKLEYVELV